MDITSCRICKSNNLSDVINLGEQYITSRFPKYGDWSTSKTPITIDKCQDCGLVQLKQTTLSSELYEYEYGYRSGISNTMREHLGTYQKEIVSFCPLQENDTVVDIGSNDSTMLHNYPDNCKLIGVDPTGSQFKQYYGDVELIPTYFTYDNFRQIYPTRKAKIVSSISMFYDLPDPVQFAKDIFNILEDDGIWTCEQSYLPSMLKTNSIDTICHEHLEYYALHQIKNIADRSGFKIFHVSFNDCNGGSFRIYFAKKESTRYVETTEQINKILQEELYLFEDSTYVDFMTRCDEEIDKLKTFIDCVNMNKKQCFIYGASTKGNCLLQYANLGEKDIKYAVERNLNKVGKMTSTGIEIISEETMRKNPPEFLLVLPWHFRDEIVKRENEFLQKGGQLVFPFPHFEIVSAKPKVLITGIDGMISRYLQKEIGNDYTVYGIGRSNVARPVTCFSFDLLDFSMLEKVISIVKPTCIIHLASISSAQYALEHPTETCMTNGMICVKLCELAHKYKCKLFNASSSELYKGHVNYHVEEDDTNMFHLHPYSIAKKMGHEMVQFYREKYGLPFSNGVLFTVESELKRPEFLLNKVTQHAKEWNGSVLELGSLSSYRNILHATDAAKAIKIIIEQPKGDDYLICGQESFCVEDLVLQIYKKYGIIVNKQGIDENGVQVFKIRATTTEFDSQPTNITGRADKLASLGWIAEKFLV